MATNAIKTAKERAAAIKAVGSSLVLSRLAEALKTGDVKTVQPARKISDLRELASS